MHGESGFFASWSYLFFWAGILAMEMLFDRWAMLFCVMIKRPAPGGEGGGGKGGGGRGVSSLLLHYIAMSRGVDL